MIIYEDEWAVWDDIAGRYILKHATTEPNTGNIIEAAGFYADSMVLERRKRKRARVPLDSREKDVAAVSRAG